jgi:uncharacterized membrane protein YvbJ
MYCSSCGSALTPNLVYCNKCGARVAQNEAIGSNSDIAPEFLVGAMITLFVLGLGVMIGLMAVMKRGVGFEWQIILAITLLCFSLLFLIEGILIFFLFRGTFRRKRKDVELLKEPTTKELEAGAPLGLPANMGSVTEHTTRAFDPVYSEKK